MNYRNLLLFALLSLLTFQSCAQSNQTPAVSNQPSPPVEPNDIATAKVKNYHKFDGWYCPDNLKGFPAVDIERWQSVPAINGRMPTEKETKNGTSLIFVDAKEYPNAKPLSVHLPRLAHFYNSSSKKREIVIVIQAIQILGDSIVGFRYLHGGNGSALINKIAFLSDEEIKNITPSRFVSLDIQIDATQSAIWDVLTKPEYSSLLQPIFDQDNKLKADWHKSSKVNFKYIHSGKTTSKFAESLFGNQYIQMDFASGAKQYVEKFLLIEDKKTKKTKLQIVCGPYDDDFDSQKNILNRWAQKVKKLSEENSPFRPTFLNPNPAKPPKKSK